jgi:hypothetical protein
MLRTAVMLLLLAGGFSSCQETPEEWTQILLQNQTDSLLHVLLFPNEKYIDPRNGFVVYDVGSGWIGIERDLPINNNIININPVIYSSNNLDIQPYALAKEVFDSIYICAANKDSVIIKFTHDNVIGYSENIFSEQSTMSVWNFRIVVNNLQTQFQKNPQKYYQYNFLILKDKIINN